eukprot:IDg4400t1
MCTLAWRRSLRKKRYLNAMVLMRIVDFTDVPITRFTTLYAFERCTITVFSVGCTPRSSMYSAELELDYDGELATCASTKRMCAASCVRPRTEMRNSLSSGCHGLRKS